MHPLPAHSRRLTDSSYLALAAGIFVLALAVQLGLYLWLLRPALSSAAGAGATGSFVRWIAVDLAWQVAVLGTAWAYVSRTSHPSGIAWVLPPVAAVLGTALPLQVVAAVALRAARRGD